MNDCGHFHPAAPGLHGQGLDAALAEADRRCAESGERLTTPRRRVLELLLQAGQPVKAYDLIAAFGVDGEPAKPPTVYRSLDFLSRAGMAHRIESLSAYMACRLGADPHAAGFLICDCCGSAREIHPRIPPEISGAAQGFGFQLGGVTIEAHGRCGDCAAA